MTENVNSIARKVLEDWKKESEILIKDLEQWSDRDILLYSNIIHVSERERETARALLDMRLLEKQQNLLKDVKSAVGDFNAQSCL